MASLAKHHVPDAPIFPPGRQDGFVAAAVLLGVAFVLNLIFLKKRNANAESK